jgi:hypothetical protein
MKRPQPLVLALRPEPAEVMPATVPPSEGRTVYACSADGRREAAYYSGAAWYQAKAGGTLLPFAVDSWQEMAFV